MKIEAKKKDRTVLWAVVIVVTLLAVFLILAFVVPIVSAHSKLSDKLEGFKDISDTDVMQVFDPMYREGGFFGDVTAEVRSDEIEELADKVIYVCEGAKYRSTEESIIGNWDMSVVLRKEDGSLYTVYFTDKEIYVTSETKQYIFEPADDRAEAHSELVDELGKRISEKKSSGA